MLALAVLLGLGGCSRTYYRRQADADVNRLIAQKSDDPRWALPGFTIAQDPRSRYYDVYSIDRPPMPPDDPAAHRYMHYIDGKRGWPHWEDYGFRNELANPYWRETLDEYVPVTADGEVFLSLESAVTLAYVHSPDYQEQLETLYLSALDVSAERFRFDTQFFGGNLTAFEHNGELSGPAGETNVLTTDTDFLVQRQFATAGELLVGFANSFVWQFAGPNTNSTMSILNFNLIQPLLRGAGRDIALEQLNIAERGLLANLRAFQRYRQGFFTQVAVGESGVAGPQRRGGFFGGTGITGFTGTGSGGLGGVGAATGFGFGGFGAGGAGAGGAGAGFAGGGAGTVGGFIGLLQQLQQIRNTQESLGAQQRTLRLLEANLEAGTIDLTQVDQFRQNIETERANLLQAQNALQNALDTYRTGTLGLPPDLPMTLNDELIEQFQFISPPISEIQAALADFLNEFGELPLVPPEDVLRQALDRIAEYQQLAEAQFDVVREDLAYFYERSEERLPTMEAGDRQTLQSDRERLDNIYQNLLMRLDAIGPRLEALRAQLTPENLAVIADQIVELTTDLSLIVEELALVQARSRVESIQMEPIELTSEAALAIARAARLDWMNNRAALVDSWRLIQFNADALQSDLDVVFSGDVSTVGKNPLDFRGQTGTLRASVEFDAPFTRLLERNNYRQALIDYQQARRQLIQYEDTVHQQLRQRLRNLEQLRVNLEIQRRAVAIAIRRVDQTREILYQPAPPVEPGQPAAQLGPTAALNLLTALSDLRSSQDNLMSVWLNYHAERMRLMRDLGVMEIDARGMWTDRPLVEIVVPPAEEVLTPPPIPPDWWKAADQLEAIQAENPCPVIDYEQQPTEASPPDHSASRTKAASVDQGVVRTAFTAVGDRLMQALGGDEGPPAADEESSAEEPHELPKLGFGGPAQPVVEAVHPGPASLQRLPPTK